MSAKFDVTVFINLHVMNGIFMRSYCYCIYMLSVLSLYISSSHEMDSSATEETLGGAIASAAKGSAIV